MIPNPHATPPIHIDECSSPSTASKRFNFLNVDAAADYASAPFAPQPAADSSPSTINSPPSTSIDTPLLSRATHSTFHRKTGLGTQAGWVYPQCRTKDDHRHHPEFFYVEWPAASEDFREIHAPTLAAITGNQAPTGHCFRLHEVAALIAAMHTIPVPQLLHACRPK